MGLDNGIDIRFKKEKINNEEIRNKLLAMLDELCELIDSEIGAYDLSDLPEALEVCYWRKYWYLRDEIVKYLEKVYPEVDTDNAYYVLNRDDISYIRHKCLSYLKGGMKASTIWSRVEECGRLGESVAKLEALIDIVSNFEELNEYFEIIFYDSY